MTFRKDKKRFMVYPEDTIKEIWDVLITITLITACIITPLDIAFQSELSTSIFDNPVSLIVDLLFFLDIIVIFNSSYYNMEINLV